MMMGDERQKVGLMKLLRVAVVAGPLLVMSPWVISGELEFVLSVPGIPGPYC